MFLRDVSAGCWRSWCDWDFFFWKIGPWAFCQKWSFDEERALELTKEIVYFKQKAQPLTKSKYSVLFSFSRAFRKYIYMWDSNRFQNDDLRVFAYAKPRGTPIRIYSVMTFSDAPFLMKRTSRKAVAVCFDDRGTIEYSQMTDDRWQMTKWL